MAILRVRIGHVFIEGKVDMALKKVRGTYLYFGKGCFGYTEGKMVTWLY